MENILVENYKKEADGRSYLFLNKTKHTYEERMIREAMPAGVLPMVKSEREDCYKYDITGRKTLSMTFERVPMNAEQVQKVLQGILTVLEQAGEYLLSEDCFILQPEHIFLRIPEYEVTLCYYPGYGVSFPEQMGKLFEMLLNRVDYREEKAIALVYALYMQLQEPDMTLGRMKEKLNGHAAEEMKKSGETAEPEVSVEENRIGNAGEKGRKKQSFLERIKEEMSLKLPLQASEKKSRVMREKKTLLPPVKSPPETETVPPPAYVMEPVPEWGGQRTRVISVKNESEVPVLASEETGELIRLVKFPFYIGSLAGYADYVIQSNTVSRFHAKLTKEGEEIFLTDLNSTNGTKVNGTLLNVRESVRLLQGDSISFADKRYCYFVS